MRNSDFITLNQCAVYSCQFPTKDIIPTIEKIKGYINSGEVKWEVITNPINGKKVTELPNGGVFFSLHIEWINFAKALLEHQIWKMKQIKKHEPGYVGGLSEKEIVKSAKELLLGADLPYSSEVVNFFYSPETHDLIANSRSPRVSLALGEIVKAMKVVKFETFVVSESTLGLTAKLTALLNENKPMFDLLSFANQATLVRKIGEHLETVNHLDCTILDSEPQSRERVIRALKEGYKVQSVKLLWIGADNHYMSFKLTSSLRINKIKFGAYDRMKSTVSTNAFGKHAVEFEAYITQQYYALTSMIKGLLHGFVKETQLESEI